jgi:hypothetical protein
MRNNSSVRSAVLKSCIGLVALLSSGCGNSDQIEVYVVDNQKALQAKIGKQSSSSGPTDRMLAAVIPDEHEFGWFFLIVDNKDAVAAVKKDYLTFLKTVDFADRKPTWALPAGWIERPGGGGGLRFATIVVPGDGQNLELRVSRLGYPKEGRDQALLSNINRWRGQMGKSALVLDELADEVKTFEASDRTVSYVEYVGKYDPQGGMRRGMDRLGNDRPSLDQIHKGVPEFKKPKGGGNNAGPSGFDPAVMTCVPPEQWTATGLTNFRKAAYEVVDGNNRAEITVISVGGSELDNVNRWRGQILLKSINQSDLAASVEPIDVGSLNGRYLELVGPADAPRREAIYAAWVTAGDRPWFVKLRGDAKLAERERQRFKAFVNSLKFK